MCFNIKICKCLASSSTSMSNFHPLEVMVRGSETQLKVGENLYFIIQRFKGEHSDSLFRWLSIT